MSRAFSHTLIKCYCRLPGLPLAPTTLAKLRLRVLSHSRRFVQRGFLSPSRTTIPTAFLCQISTTSRLPRVTAVLRRLRQRHPAARRAWEHHCGILGALDGEAATRSALALGEDGAFRLLRVGNEATLEVVGVEILDPEDAETRAQLLDRHGHRKIRLGL